MKQKNERLKYILESVKDNIKEVEKEIEKEVFCLTTALLGSSLSFLTASII